MTIDLIHFLLQFWFLIMHWRLYVFGQDIMECLISLSACNLSHLSIDFAFNAFVFSPEHGWQVT